MPKQWYHVVLRRDASTLSFFFNGAPAVTRNGPAAQRPLTDPLLVGKRNDFDGRDFSFNGRIDELALWGRALTDGEIAKLYNGGQGIRASVIN